MIHTCNFTHEFRPMPMVIKNMPCKSITINCFTLKIKIIVCKLVKRGVHTKTYHYMFETIKHKSYEDNIDT